MANLAIAQQAGVTALAMLQQEFAIYCGNGAYGVVDLAALRRNAADRLAPRLVIFPRSEANTLLRRRLETIGVPVAVPKSVIDAYWVDPATIVYDSITFTPNTVPPPILNLWVPPTISPAPGPWPQIEEFLRETICANDAALYDYLLNFLAHAFQRPAEKPGVIIIFLGGQGSGKGSFEVVNLLLRWPSSYVRSSTSSSRSCRFLFSKLLF